MRFPSNGMAFGSIIASSRGSFIAMALIRSRRAGEAYTMEKHRLALRLMPGERCACRVAVGDALNVLKSAVIAPDLPGLLAILR
jgi:hypothetical protein